MTRADRPDRPRPARPRRRSTGRRCSRASSRRAAARCARVPPMGRDDLDCAATRRGDRARGAARSTGRSIVVAHSGGVHHGRALGAADAARRCAARCWRRRRISSSRCRRAIRRWTRCDAGGWLPVPRERAAVPEHRRGQPQRSARRASSASPTLARDWGSQLVDLGEVGHLNPASGFGAWPPAPTRSSTDARRSPARSAPA